MFLQTVSFTRKFIRNFSKISAPLAKYQKKNCPRRFRPGLVGDEEAQKAFEYLKERLMSAPVLAPPDYSKPFYVHTDASGRGAGCALAQKDAAGRTQVVMYASRALKDTELSYSTYELEFLAGRFAFGVFHEYIAHSKVYWVTDHSALLTPKLQKRGRTQRWLADMMQYDFSVIFVPGKNNTLPDGLSRFPLVGPSVYDVDEVPILSVQTAHGHGVARPDHLEVNEVCALLNATEWAEGQLQVVHATTEVSELRRGSRKREQTKILEVSDFRRKRQGKQAGAAESPGVLPALPTLRLIFLINLVRFFA